MAKQRKKTPANRKSPTGAAPSFGMAGKAFIIAFTGLTCIAAGYVWRSYAPLPFFKGTALSASSSEKKDRESLEAEKIRRELEEIDEMREEKEAELGDAQIKAILSD